MENDRTTESTGTAGSTSTTRSKKRWAIPAGALALGAAVLGVLALATPVFANDPGPSRVIECRSGIVTQGDVQMSAATATRVPAAQLPDTTPGGCSVR